MSEEKLKGVFNRRTRLLCDFQTDLEIDRIRMVSLTYDVSHHVRHVHLSSLFNRELLDFRDVLYAQTILDQLMSSDFLMPQT